MSDARAAGGPQTTTKAAALRRGSGERVTTQAPAPGENEMRTA
ncbi:MULTISPECIES: hypothetical protein [Streptomyces]|nr:MULTISPECIES: hypothetical protein [Streptomyces]MCY0982524.1 hypothetical protein [Streptomyces tirandamycinicus]